MTFFLLLKIVGYYHANAQHNSNGISPTARRIADKINETVVPVSCCSFRVTTDHPDEGKGCESSNVPDGKFPLLVYEEE